jgi:hypothetical protein
VKLQVLQQLLLQRLYAPPLIVQRRHLVQRLFQPCPVDRLRQEIGGSPADRFQRRFRIFPCHHDDVHARVAAQHLV